MQRYEFKVVPAPRRGEKARGVKSTEERFALALTNLMNRLGAEGWDYVRADHLPCDERSGLTGVKTTEQHLLVFRRALPERGFGLGPQLGAPEPLPAETTFAAAPVLGPSTTSEA